MKFALSNSVRSISKYSAAVRNAMEYHLSRNRTRKARKNSTGRYKARIMDI